MSQAIIVKRIPATNYRPTRLKAFCERGSIVVGIDHGKSDQDNATEALKALVCRFLREDAPKTPMSSNPWRGKWVCGYSPKVGYIFTCMSWAGEYTRIDTVDGVFI